ncbi:hypothetical protein LCGC14_0902450 [marine sediment metagenome]|uniref:Uncharacterized protein n=1 Tax=marine sediment metagenome TaxID=412755 RepID=A0A0F9RF28_9ZZZZ
MEKKEAIREWCVDKAIVLHSQQHSGSYGPEDIVKTAKEIEKYIKEE